MSSHLVFPERVEISVLHNTSQGLTPWAGPPLAFSVRTFARSKNDYRLGPFFTGEGGALAMTRRQLGLHAAAVLDSGLMDYQKASEGFALVEIVHWSGDEVARVAEARSTTWTSLLDGEGELFGTIESLKARLHSAGNHLLRPPVPYYHYLRDEWDGSRESVTYDYVVASK